MSTISMSKKHLLSHEKAKAAARKIADDLSKRFELRCAWHGDSVHFERAGVSGTLTVGKSDVRLDAKLGLLLTFLKPTIEDVVHRDFDKYFGAPSAPHAAPKAGHAPKPRAKA